MQTMQTIKTMNRYHLMYVEPQSGQSIVEFKGGVNGSKFYQPVLCSEEGLIRIRGTALQKVQNALTAMHEASMEMHQLTMTTQPIPLAAGTVKPLSPKPPKLADDVV